MKQTKLNLHISPNASRKVNNAILVSGSSRSGTTILGKLLHSFAGVEYVFEPPMLFSLVALIEDLPEEHWKLLYETYLYEEFLINAVSGRNINCNCEDDSSIYRVKTEASVHARLDSSIGKTQAERLSGGCTIAYKMPDIVPFLPRIVQYYPDTRVIIVRRGANETLNSMMTKKWFSNEKRNANLIWPFRIYKDFQIPFWVKGDDLDAWVDMTELDRCAYYYIRVNQSLEAIPGRIEVKYHDLTDTPAEIASHLANQLNLSFGEKTPDILRTIKPIQRERDAGLLQKISLDLLDSVEYYSSLSE